MSMWPAWRAVSSIMWNMAQRHVVGRKSAFEGWSSDGTRSSAASARAHSSR